MLKMLIMIKGLRNDKICKVIRIQKVSKIPKYPNSLTLALKKSSRAMG